MKSVWAHATIIAGVLATLGAHAPALAGGHTAVWPDPANDAAIHRTDLGNDGPVPVVAQLPDIVAVRLSGWQSPTPATNPYNGSAVDPDGAHLFRLDVEFLGLVNPPGLLDPFNYSAFEFGPSPVYGFLDIDIDEDRQTGGELGCAANFRFLANIARFGGLPDGSISDWAARSGDDLDCEFETPPEVERTGADFALTFCGCSPVTVVSGDDGDSVFEIGETWIVQGRFFRRSGGYSGASPVSGGSAPGEYDPAVRLRFRHEAATDLTTVSFVYALDMHGAAMLAGQPQQPVDLRVNNHTSLLEALTDLVDSAENPPYPEYHLIERWENRDPTDYLDPTDWEITALFGTAYAEYESSLFVWTDAGFEWTYGDVDGDGISGPLDLAALQGYIAANDGVAGEDADGVVNGAVVVPDFSANFSVFDLNYDGRVDGADAVILGAPACTPDWNGDSALNSDDYFAFLTDFFTGNADFNNDSVTNSDDYFAFLAAFFAGC